jgi:heat shock protein HtpX
MYSAATAVFYFVLLVGGACLVGAAGGAIIALVSTAATKLGSVWNSDTLIPAGRSGREATGTDAPELLAAVRELAQRAAIPAPRVYLIDSTQFIALAAGRGPGHAAICLSTGVLEAFSRDEIDGIVAHELAHIVHRYSLMATAAAMLAAIVALAVPLAAFFRFGFAGGLVTLIVAPFAAVIVQLAILRGREYGADRFAARLCRRPAALASVLARLVPPEEIVPRAARGGFLVTALFSLADRLSAGKRDNLFASHPRMENRIRALEKLSRAMGVGDTGSASAAHAGTSR